MRQWPIMLACAVVLAAPQRSLRAQATADTTTAAFHQGEWGVGFILRSSVTSAGVLRFSTPTRAWVFDGSVSLDRGSVSGSNISTNQMRSAYFDGQFGPRWYRAQGGHVARYLGFGVSGAYEYSESSTSSSHGDLWSLGAYGEAGMQYLITRYLGIGWRGTVNASRLQTKNTNTDQGVITKSQSSVYHVGLDAVQLTGNIYF